MDAGRFFVALRTMRMMGALSDSTVCMQEIRRSANSPTFLSDGKRHANRLETLGYGDRASLRMKTIEPVNDSEMNYFPYSLIAAANGWDDGGEQARSRASVSFWKAVERYYADLDGLQGRVSQSAWTFFRYGSGERGLHDARLVSFAIGDGLSYISDGSAPFLRNRQAATGRIEFINYEQTYGHVFDLRGVRKCALKFQAEESTSSGKFGDLYTYELTSAANGLLSIGFLFADEAEISIEFQRLVYRRRRLESTT